MKRTLILSLAFFIIFPFTARTQNEGIKPVANPASSQKSTKYEKSTREMAMMQDQNTTGGTPCPSGLPSENASCYLEPGWVPGKVVLTDNSTIDHIMLRYDLYNQQLQFIRDKDTLAFAKPEEVRCFELGGQHFEYLEYQSENLVGHGYFEVVTEGNCKLLLRRTVKYHVSPEADPILDEDVYVRECGYYISKKGEVAKALRVNKKSVLCAFKDKEEQVEKYMEDHNMKMNTCDQLKEVVAYYNTLP